MLHIGMHRLGYNHARRAQHLSIEHIAGLFDLHYCHLWHVARVGRNRLVETWVEWHARGDIDRRNACAQQQIEQLPQSRAF